MSWAAEDDHSEKDVREACGRRREAFVLQIGRKIPVYLSQVRVKALSASFGLAERRLFLLADVLFLGCLIFEGST